MISTFFNILFMECIAFSDCREHNQSVYFNIFTRRIVIVVTIVIAIYWCGTCDWATNTALFVETVAPVVQAWIGYLTPLVGPGNRSNTFWALGSETVAGNQYRRIFGQMPNLDEIPRDVPPVTGGSRPNREG